MNATEALQQKRGVKRAEKEYPKSASGQYQMYVLLETLPSAGEYAGPPQATKWNVGIENVENTGVKR